MRDSLLMLGSAVLAIVLGGPVLAQSAPQGEPDELRSEMASLGRSLGRVGQALDALVRLQRTGLLLQRVRLEQQRLAPREAELRGARDRARQQNQVIAELEAVRQGREEMIAEAVRSGSETAPHIKEGLAQLERALEVEVRGLEDVELRIQELENDLSRARRLLDILDEKLDEAFEEIEGTR